MSKKAEEYLDFAESAGPEGDVIDFTGTDDIDKALEPGIYGPAVITKAEKKTSEKGNTYWALTFEIRPDAAEGAGRKVWHNITITQNNLRYVRRDLSRLGIDVTGKVRLVPETFIGCVALLKLGTREWDGEVRNEIREILPYIGGDPANAFLK